jgi:hypothetical protein
MIVKSHINFERTQEDDEFFFSITLLFMFSSLLWNSIRYQNPKTTNAVLPLHPLLLREFLSNTLAAAFLFCTVTARPFQLNHTQTSSAATYQSKIQIKINPDQSKHTSKSLCKIRLFLALHARPFRVVSHAAHPVCFRSTSGSAVVQLLSI